MTLSSLLAACGSGARSVPSAASSTPPIAQSTARQPASIVITIPKETAPSAKARAPRYVSPATQSIRIVVSNSSDGSTVSNQSANLSPTATGCNSTLAGTQCTLILALAPGSYTAAVSTYDGAVVSNLPSGNELSQAQGPTFTIVAGQNNQVNLSLNGIPAALTVYANDVHVGGTAGRFAIVASAPHRFLIAAFDRDGNFIVGPGAPTYSVSTYYSGFTITHPTTAAPNQFTIAPSSSSGAAYAAFSVQAAFDDNTCSLSGAVCSTGFTIAQTTPTIYVAGQSTATAYQGTAPAVFVHAPPYANGATSLTAGLGTNYLTSVAVNPSSQVFVRTAAPSVLMYAQSAPTTPTVVTTSMSASDTRIFATAGYLIVGSATAAGRIYAAPYNGTPTSNPYATGMSAVDALGNLYTLGGMGSEVYEQQPPYTAPLNYIGVSENAGLAVDAAGDVFVAGTYGIVEHLPPYGMTNDAIVSNANASNITLSGDGTVFTYNTATQLVTVFAPPYVGQLATTTFPATLSTAHPNQTAADAGGDFYVANPDSGTLTMYAPPYTSAGTVISTTDYAAAGIVVK